MLLAHPLPGLPQRLDLPHPADEEGLVPALGRLVDQEQPVGEHRLALSLQLERLDCFHVDRLADEREGRFTEQDVARARRLLQARGHVDGIAGCQALLGAGHDLARVKADPGLHTERGQRFSHLDRGSDRTKRVVLVDDRDAEDGHDRVANELLHRPTVRLDDPPHPLEVARQQGTQRLRIGRLAKCCRAGHVAEQDRDRLPLLARRWDRAQHRAAVGAKGEVSFALAATAGADRHLSKVKPAGTTTTERRRASKPLADRRRSRPISACGRESERS